MRQTGLLGCYKGVLVLLAASFSFKCLAFGEEVLAQDLETIELGLIGIAILIGVLALLWIVQSIKLSHVRRALIQQKLTLSDNQNLLDSSSEGLVKLSDKGEVVLFNHAASFLLGAKPESLRGQVFSALFNAEQAAAINEHLSVQTSANMQLFSRNRHLLLQFKRDPLLPSFTLVSIYDVTNSQLKLDKLTRQLNSKMAMLERAEIGQLTVDFEKKRFTFDPVLSATLALDAEAQQGDVNQLPKYVVNADHFALKQTLEQVAKGEEAQLDCHFSTKSGNLLMRLLGVVSERNSKGDVTQVQFVSINQHELAASQQQQQVSEHLSKTLLGAGKHALYILDASGKIDNTNSAFDSLFRTSLSKIKDKSIHDLDFIPNDIKQLHPTKESDYNQSRFGQDKEFEHSGLDGKVKTLKLSLRFVSDEQGKRASMVGLVEDISELKLLKQQVQQERQYLADLIELAPIGIATVDENDHFIAANKALTARLGYSLKELSKQPFYAYFSDPNQSAKAAKLLHQQGSVHGFKAKLKGSKGELLPSELNLDLIDRSRQHYLCWLADTTDEQLQRDKFEGLLHYSSMPMAELSEQGFTQLNAAACEFFDTEDQRDLLGLSPDSEQLNADDEACQQISELVAAVKTSQKVQNMRCQHRVKDRTLPCELTLVPMFKANALVSILCMWTDFRAINEAEQARLEATNLQQAAQRQVVEKQKLLENSQDQLAHQVKSLSETQTKLQAAEADLSEKQSEISDLHQAHQDITANLNRLQEEYQQSRQKLAASQQHNEELEGQLEQSVTKVRGLQEQRNQIADALQYSEKKYSAVQQELAQSEKVTKALQLEQQQQAQKVLDFEAQISDLKQSIVTKDKQIHEVSGQISALQSQLTSSSQTTDKLREQLVNQRKASEQAEEQRRQLEFTCHTAQSELSSKARHIEHLHHEMQKFEEMSLQQRDDMTLQQEELRKELEEKQRQLSETQVALTEAKKLSDSEKTEKKAQQEALSKLQSELAAMERDREKQQQQMRDEAQAMQQQQRALQRELAAKQEKLLEAEQILSESKQQTEAEKQERAKQQAIFSQLKQELDALKQHESEQQQQIAQSDEQWQQQQQLLQQEVAAKQQKLQETQLALDEKQRLADQEKRQRIEQQLKLDQLVIELADVENRANKQQAMVAGSEEQRRQLDEEITLQKAQLQQALQQAEEQNAQMQAQLQTKLQALEQAELQVQDTKSAEQQLQEELNRSRLEAQTLQQRLQQQEQQELALQKQLSEQQQALLKREQNIDELQNKQQELTAELQAVQQEHNASKNNLSQQDSDQHALAEQLAKLEQALQQSQSQLSEKENALQLAQQQALSTQQKLSEQEKALVAAHKEELQQVQASNKEEIQAAPSYASLPLPEQSAAWFDLLPFLQKQPSPGPLAVALKALLQDLQTATDTADEAMKNENLAQIKQSVGVLSTLAYRINSEALMDQISRLEMHSTQGLIDNITIAWPSIRKSILTTMRVIYSHLHA